ncbi:MAG: hypothetical protein KC496_09325 [Anaerolineae bacterium]|nr:hypothetical protein [Anaerolineae bacterium]
MSPFVSADTALCYSKRMVKETDGSMHPWIAAAQRRGLGAFLLSALDVAEPIAPVLAQALWVMQPTVGLFGGASALAQLAETLEAPDGVAQLRQQLQETDG